MSLNITAAGLAGLGLDAPPTEAGSSTLLHLPVGAPQAKPTAPVDDAPHTPLVARLAQQFGAQWVDETTVQAWAAEGGTKLLLLAGDAVRFPEGQDVAAVLPELQRCVGLPFAIGVAPAAREDAIARRYGVQRWPSLLCLRDGSYVGTLAGMHDWLPFVQQLQALLQQPASRVPGIGIPLVSAGAGNASSCH